MANSFAKKQEDLKNKHKNQSVNKKIEEMTQRGMPLVEKVKKEEIKPINNPSEYKEEVKEVTKIEIKPEVKEAVKEVTKTEVIPEINPVNTIKPIKTKVNVVSVDKIGMSTDEFLDLNIYLDRFEGSNTSVTINVEIYNVIKEYSDLKNLTMNFFINKLIRVGLENINELTIEDIQKNLCFSAKTKSIPFIINEKLDGEFNLFIDTLKMKGYKFSRNTIICSLIVKILDRFHK